MPPRRASSRSEPQKIHIIQARAPEAFLDPKFRLHVKRVPRHHTMSEQHGHDFDELVVILSGRGKHHVGRQIYDIEAGEVFVILRGMSHCYPECDNLCLFNILYDADQIRMPRADLRAVPGYQALFEIEPRFRAQTRFKSRLKLSVKELARLVPLVAELQEELESNTPGHRFLAIAHFMRLVAWLSRAYSQIPHEDPPPVTQLSKVLSYIEENYTEPLGVEELAQVAGMSQPTLFRTFQQILGRSPIDHVVHLRIDKATRLLTRTDKRIGEISGEVGFNDSNYFTRQFRAITGCSPREYRERTQLKKV